MKNDLKTGSKAKSKLIKFGIFGAVLLIAFLIGLVPMWIQKRDVAANLATVEKQLNKSEIEGLILEAIVDSNRGEYETARQNASDFFTKLQTEIDKAADSTYPAEQNDKLKGIFVNRDAVITMLAQRDQASVQRLSDIYSAYSEAVNEAKTPTENQPAANANSAELPR